MAVAPEPLSTDNCVACKIRSHLFFCDLPRPALEAFESIKRSSVYPARALLFMEGQGPRGIYLLCQGRVKIYMTSVLGKALVLKYGEAGEILGLHATIANQPYDATAEVLETSRIAFVTQADFLRFLQQHSEACLRAAQQLSERCQDAFDQIRLIGLSHSASEKLARLLLEWAEAGEESPQGIRVKLDLTQEEIAQLMGTTRETVNRLLGRFEGANLIRVQGSTVFICDRAALADRVQT